ncbi:hypothetical protein [Pedobacter sp. FW305-3-2-15-E-R2A2]|uniref:hypothetical protein n=1 Tax=Pedobacter sp. FW305-3-2-15-E-R2A2 TaxID=3140251 RepID=UPI0031408DE7
MQVKAKDYQEHPLFNDLATYSKFYDHLADLNMHWVTQGVKNILNIDTYVFNSIQGTLESIFDILKKGRINDAYTLLRKYYDSAIINLYSKLYLDDHFGFDNYIVEKINNWIEGKETIPGFEKMSKYIINSKKVAEITELIYNGGDFKKSSLESIRQRCNEHTHYLYYHTLLLNNSEVYIEERIDLLNKFRADLREIFILHIGYLFFFSDNYMMSSDYIDSLDMGEKPERDSEYWVAPFVQDIFDGVLKKFRPDIVEAIKGNTQMQLS